METICPQDQCTGCAACMNVCPRDAISMQPSGALQHIFPVINQALCIDCGLCVKTCPVNHPSELHSPLKAFAAISRDEQDLMSSTSGGASSLFCQHILSQGGIVYGCVQKNYCDIAHQRISTPDEASTLKGSKYVQSNINYIYRQVKKDLQDKRLVLFTGTPCQIAGLRAYLRKNYENLYLVDLVCHGVPSQHLLRENVEQMLEKKPHYPSPIVDFRKKNEPLIRTFGTFLRHCRTVSEKKQAFLHNDYITAFMSGLTFRRSCYTCRYAQQNRGSDITISDFWGIGKSKIPTNKGISLMLQNTEKGGKLIQSIQLNCYCEERPVTEAIQGNGQLIKPFTKPHNRDAFEADYARLGTTAYTAHLRQYRHQWKTEHGYTLSSKLRRAYYSLRARLKKTQWIKTLYYRIKQK